MNKFVQEYKLIVYGLYYFFGFFTIDKILVNEDLELKSKRIVILLLIHLVLNYFGKMLYYFCLSILYKEGIFKNLSLILISIFFPLLIFLLGNEPIGNIGLNDFMVLIIPFSVLFLFFEEVLYKEDKKRKKNKK